MENCKLSRFAKIALIQLFFFLSKEGKICCYYYQRCMFMHTSCKANLRVEKLHRSAVCSCTERVHRIDALLQKYGNSMLC